ncbi:MAG: LacI family DNA-binding transcriptional regulator, partial [Actinoplanes sp.]
MPQSGLKEVAALAGVSVKTVSNVVNGYVHVSPETRARVQAAIEALGYVPNTSARRLRSGRSGVIALAVPELAWPYFAEMATRIARAADERGWALLIEQTEGLAERERAVISGARLREVDGLIFSPVGLAAEDLGQPGEIPMVLLGERVQDGAADHVAIDGAAAAADATRHLTGLGRRRIAAIGLQDESYAVTARQRLAGYRQALDEAGLPTGPARQMTVPGFRRRDGAAAMARLLDSGDPPDAVFCFNDLLALGALRTLLARGIAVPGDVAVIGFDNIEDGRFSTPTLSTVAPDVPRIAQLAVDLLAERLEGDPAATAPP